MQLSQVQRLWVQCGACRNKPERMDHEVPAQNRKQHTLITGTGRSGTTLLMRVLTNLGIDTGFESSKFKAIEARIGKAGLEKAITKETAANLPIVVKAPNIGEILPDILAENWFDIDRAIIPVRQLEDAADSRISVSERAMNTGKGKKKALGGLWKTADPMLQPFILAEQFYRTIETLAAYNIPITFLHFPRFAHDGEYFVTQLGEYLAYKFEVTDTKLLDALAAESKPELIDTWK